MFLTVAVRGCHEILTPVNGWEQGLKRNDVHVKAEDVVAKLQNGKGNIWLAPAALMVIIRALVPEERGSICDAFNAKLLLHQV